jgi:ribosomal-protein-alanine N-acetyltransferase|tara:strand:+ start:11792 stop:12325 length:534 start_codon:yes stop_codon:yes gene_type:complete
MNIQTLTTPRLTLQRVDQKVMDYVFEKLSPQERMLFLGCNSADQLHEQERRYNGGLSTFNKTFVYFFIRLTETNEHLGWCGYHTWYTDHHRAEIGYQLNKKYHNQGIMTEAMKSIIYYGFSTLKLKRIEAFVGEENIPSLRLMQIFGFEKEGLIRKHYNVNGENLDSLLFALLNSYS